MLLRRTKYRALCLDTCLLEVPEGLLLVTDLTSWLTLKERLIIKSPVRTKEESSW